jgi:L-asparaginase/Glu-tRNA(Gln) amidotransferase subunit D
MGFVLLFGTDTLAFLASACALGLHHLPCPLVITGANQPPKEKDVAARSLFYARSDAWKNLMTSLYFLQCFGHRLTESFVCFGETVHHGVNLRKAAMDSMLLVGGSQGARYQEPFAFRNLSLRGQYMFRLIDGMFCNNYYSNASLNYSDMVGHESPEFFDLRHIRWNALQEVQPQVTESETFHSTVRFVEVTPSFPWIDLKEIMGEEGGGGRLRAVLVEGYPSGTYPSAQGHAFAQLLWELCQRGIPVVLVSRFGIMATQQEYEVSTIKGVKIPVLPLFGIVTETALPLLSLVVGGISAEEWEFGSSGDALQLVKLRLKRIHKGISAFLTGRPNIISQEILEVSDRVKLTERSAHSQEDINAEIHDARWVSWRDRCVPSDGETHANVAFEEMMSMPRGMFLPFLGEIVDLFERVGAGPDGFAAISDIGFRLGLSLVGSVDSGRGKVMGFTLFYEREKQERLELAKQASSLLSSVAATLRRSGIADVETSDVSVIWDDPEAGVNSINVHKFAFSVTAKRRDEIGRGDEKYAVMSFSEEEAEYFSLLSRGCSGDVGEHLRRLQKLYRNLLRKTWQCSTGRMDWFIVGVFKGATCGLAESLRFDSFAVSAARFRDSGHINALRRAVQVRPLVGDEYGFKASFSYSEIHSAEE